MLAWLKTAEGMLATFATALAIVATWWQLGLARVVLYSEIMVMRRDCGIWGVPAHLTGRNIRCGLRLPRRRLGYSRQKPGGYKPYLRPGTTRAVIRQ